MLLRETKGAPGELPLQARPRRPLGGSGTGWGGAPRVWESLPSYLALLTRGAGLVPGFYVRQRLAPALTICWELPASEANLLTPVKWGCVFVPLEGVTEVYIARCT